MPFVKSISIHKNVQNTINYILNENKTDISTLVSGINVSTDNEIAAMQFKHTYNQYIGKYESENKKQIISHHFIQSFKANEVTPEVAHKIALETCKKHFGEDVEILISTHTNTEKIHTHILVNSVDLNLKKYYANKLSLMNLRKLSDSIALENNLSVIQNTSKYNSMKYNIWQEKQKGLSWKDKSKLAIDTAILNSKNIIECIDEIKKQGYDCEIRELKSGIKYIAMKEPKYKYFANTKNFGAGYSFDEVIYKIENKDVEQLKLKIQIEKIKYTQKVNKANNIQVRYQPYNINKKKRYRKFKYIGKYRRNKFKTTINYKIKRAIFKLFKNIDNNKVVEKKKCDRSKPYSKQNDYYVQTMMNRLNFVTENNIYCYNDLVRLLIKEKNNHTLLQDEINTLSKQKSNLITVSKAQEIISELSVKENLNEREKLVLDKSTTILKKAKERNLDTGNLSIYEIEESIREVKEKLEINSEQLKKADDTYNWITNADADITEIEKRIKEKESQR